MIFLYMLRCPIHNFMLHFSCCMVLLLVRYVKADYCHAHEHCPESLWTSPVASTKIVVCMDFYATVLANWMLSRNILGLLAFTSLYFLQLPMVSFWLLLTSSFTRNSWAWSRSQITSRRQFGYTHPVWRLRLS